MSPLHLLLGAVLGSVVSGYQEGPDSVRETILGIVRERYRYASSEHVESVTSQIYKVLQASPADPQRVRTILGNLNQIIQYAQSFVGPYDLKSAGSESAPSLPEPMKQLQHDLELHFVEQYVTDALTSTPITGKERTAISGQIDFVLQEARNLMIPRFTGPYASDAISLRLGEIRAHLLGTFDFPSSSGFPRLLTHSEVSDLLSSLRKAADGVEPLEFTQALDAHRTSGATLEAVTTHNKYMSELDRIASRLWTVFDLWGPKRSEIKGRLEKLSKEVQAWRLATDAERRRIEREARVDLADMERDESKPSSSLDFSTPAHSANQKPATTAPESTGPKPGLSLWAYAISVLAVLVCIVVVSKYVRRLVN